MNKKNLYWLSFLKDAKSKKPQYLGACCVHATSQVNAVIVALRLNIHPGGDTKILGPLSFPAEFTSALIKSKYFEKLLDEKSVTECMELFNRVANN